MPSRMPSRTARAALLCAGLVFAGAPLAAQQPTPPRQPQDTTTARAPARGMMQMMGMMAGCPMMSAMMHGPAAALRARDALHLSPTQVQRLETAQRRVEQAHARAMDSMRVIHPRLASLAGAPRFDERATRAAFERMGRLHTDVGVAMLRAQHEAADVLTPQQRDSLAAIGRAQMASMPGMSGAGPAGMAAGGMDMCAGMMQMGPPAAKPDSAHEHEHRPDSSARRP